MSELKINTRTTQIFIIHKNELGDLSFFELPDAEFNAYGWFLCYVVKDRSTIGMKSNISTEPSYIRQKGIEVGKVKMPFYDDHNNPFWAINFTQPVELQKIRQNINLPTELPKHSKSFWMLEKGATKIKNENEVSKALRIENNNKEFFMRNSEIKIVEHNGKYYLDVGKTGLLLSFMIQINKDECGMVAFTGKLFDKNLVFIPQ